VCKANELCNRYGMDTISCGATVAWAMEAFEAGVLTEKDTGGIRLQFGDSPAMLEMVRQIAERDAFGKILGEGSARAARLLGKGENFLVTCKGQEVPAHMPHLKRSLALMYAVNPFGADHQSHEHDGACGPAGFANYQHKLELMGISQPLELSSLAPAKIDFIRKTQFLYSMLDSLCLCQFVWGAGWQLLGPAEIIEVTRAATGWDVTIDELLTVGERRVNMMRVFNTRQGMDFSHDQLPQKFFDAPLKEGVAKGWTMDPAQFGASLKEYYRQCGWDPETGIPKDETLLRLGINR
jgi:aldehyde:ferredoxin oxidoreductase